MGFLITEEKSRRIGSNVSERDTKCWYFIREDWRSSQWEKCLKSSKIMAIKNCDALIIQFARA